MVPEAEFTSYYGRPVVKPAPWGHDIAAYLFLGGVAGGSALLAAGAQLTGQDTLRRNCRLAAIGAVGLGAGALVRDLGRPERFLNMLRTIKLTSPMSLGSWILSAFSVGAGVAAAAEIDRMTGERLPLGPLRGVLRAVEGPAGLEAAAFAPLLTVYTAVLLGDTATPTWNGAHEELPFVFVSSASLAASGLAMVTTPVAQAAPARRLAMARRHRRRPGDADHAPADGPRRRRAAARGPGRDDDAAERGARDGGRDRDATRAGVAAASPSPPGWRWWRRRRSPGSGCSRRASASAKDPRYTIEPQKRRLAARRAAGVTDDSITTAG